MKIKTFLSFVAAAIIGGITVFGLQIIIGSEEEQSRLREEFYSVPVRQADYSNLSAGSLDFTDAAERTIDAVVHVKTKSVGTAAPNDLYSFFFGNPYQRAVPRQTSGSGVVVSSDGYIVTNNHVIKDADEIEVTLNNNRNYTAKLVGADPATDIALIRVEAENLTVIPYGDSDNLRVGEWVLAVGNPFNLTSTVTAGIVSAKARNINILQERYAVEAFIQTDAAVNPGNSGGALVNTAGELVGINTAIASQTGSFAGYSFAVPVNIVKKIIADIIEFGVVQRAMLGVSISNIDSQMAEKLKLEKPEGVYIMAVGKESAAEDAGLLPEDVILKIDDRHIKNVPELQERISGHRPGDVVDVWVQRNGKLIKKSVTLKNSLGTTDIIQKSNVDVLGADFEEISNNEKNKLGIKNGIRVRELSNGKLLRAGVKKDFIITAINQQTINSVSDIEAIISKAQGGIYIEGIYPNGQTAYYAFGMR